MTVSITVTSDFICPWCYVGEARLAAAIADLPEGIDTAVAFRPFELNPDMPDEGMDRRQYRAAKFGSWERSQLLDRQTEAAAKADDIVFRYDLIERTPNTQLAHQLSQLAAKQGRQPGMVKAILGAYFAEGRDIGSRDVLLEIAALHGLRDSAASYLGTDEARYDVARAAQLGEPVRGVPFFEIGAFGVRGAQSVGVLKDTILKSAKLAA